MNQTLGSSPGAQALQAPGERGQELSALESLSDWGARCMVCPHSQFITGPL